MKNIKIQEQLDRYYADIRENYNLLNIIDFQQDIDVAKSEDCKYYVNDEGHLQFFYKKTLGYKPDDCRLLAENLTEKQLKKWIPQKYSNDRSGWSSEKLPYDETYNVYYIKNDKVNQQLHEADVFGIEPLRYFINHQWILCEEKTPATQENDFCNLKMKCLIDLKTDRACLYSINNGTINMSEDDFSLIEAQQVMTIIDREAARQSSWNSNQRLSITKVNNEAETIFKNPNMVWLLIVSNRETGLLNKGHEDIIQTIGFGKKTGEIFILPIESEVESVEFKVASLSQCTLEYFVQKDLAWKPVSQLSKMKVDNPARLKFILNSGETLLDCSIVRKKDSLSNASGSITQQKWDDAIDKSKSDDYRINETRGCLEFLHGRVLEIDDNEFFVMLGSEEQLQNGTRKCFPDFCRSRTMTYHFSKMCRFNMRSVDAQGIKIMVDSYEGLTATVRLHKDWDTELQFWKLTNEPSMGIGQDEVKQKRDLYMMISDGDGTKRFSRIKNGIVRDVRNSPRRYDDRMDCLILMYDDINDDSFKQNMFLEIHFFGASKMSSGADNFLLKGNPTLIASKGKVFLNENFLQNNRKVAYVKKDYLTKEASKELSIHISIQEISTDCIEMVKNEIIGGLIVIDQ